MDIGSEARCDRSRVWLVMVAFGFAAAGRLLCWTVHQTTLPKTVSAMTIAVSAINAKRVDGDVAGIGVGRSWVDARGDGSGLVIGVIFKRTMERCSNEPSSAQREGETWSSPDRTQRGCSALGKTTQC